MWCMAWLACALWSNSHMQANKSITLPRVLKSSQDSFLSVLQHVSIYVSIAAYVQLPLVALWAIGCGCWSRIWVLCRSGTAESPCSPSLSSVWGNWGRTRWISSCTKGSQTSWFYVFSSGTAHARQVFRHPAFFSVSSLRQGITKFVAKFWTPCEPRQALRCLPFCPRLQHTQKAMILICELRGLTLSGLVLHRTRIKESITLPITESSWGLGT